MLKLLSKDGDIDSGPCFGACLSESHESNGTKAIITLMLYPLMDTIMSRKSPFLQHLLLSDHSHMCSIPVIRHQSNMLKLRRIFNKEKTSELANCAFKFCVGQRQSKLATLICNIQGLSAVVA